MNIDFTYERKTLESITHFKMSLFKFGFTSTASKGGARKVEKDSGNQMMFEGVGLTFRLQKRLGHC